MSSLMFIEKPPELEIREIGELTVDQFRGIFRMSYAGDAHLVLKTKVQVRAGYMLPIFKFYSLKHGRQIL